MKNKEKEKARNPLQNIQEDAFLGNNVVIKTSNKSVKKSNNTYDDNLKVRRTFHINANLSYEFDLLCDTIRPKKFYSEVIEESMRWALKKYQ